MGEGGSPGGGPNKSQVVLRFLRLGDATGGPPRGRSGEVRGVRPSAGPGPPGEWAGRARGVAGAGPGSRGPGRGRAGVAQSRGGLRACGAHSAAAGASRSHSREHEGPNPGAPHGESGPRAPSARAPRAPAPCPLRLHPRRLLDAPGLAGIRGAARDPPQPRPSVPPLRPSRGGGVRGVAAPLVPRAGAGWSRGGPG